MQIVTLTLSANDSGFELLIRTRIDIQEILIERKFSPDDLLNDFLVCLNSAEVAKREFRDFARIAGLVFQGYPGSTKSTWQIQASSSLIYDVIKNHDSNNPLLEQAQGEVLDAQLDATRLAALLSHRAARSIFITHPKQLTPLAFTLWADRLQSQTMSTIKLINVKEHLYVRGSNSRCIQNMRFYSKNAVPLWSQMFICVRKWYFNVQG